MKNERDEELERLLDPLRNVKIPQQSQEKWNQLLDHELNRQPNSKQRHKTLIAFAAGILLGILGSLSGSHFLKSQTGQNENISQEDATVQYISTNNW